MRIHYFQHVLFEGPASIGQWSEMHGHNLTCTQIFDDPNFPNPDAFEWLVIMGGPMGVYDEDQYPWLSAEKEFVRKSIDAGKIIIGICLGAQFIAEILGAKVIRWHAQSVRVQCG